MPTRYLKPGIRDSEAIDALSPMAETFFYRLIVTVDDFGRADARPAMLKSACYPIKEAVTAGQCEAMLAELHRAGLVLVYVVGGKPYLQLCKWDNAPRSQISKFPAPPGGLHPMEAREIVSEDDLESMVCEHIANSRQFAGINVISHARQVRRDQSYLDIVLTTQGGQVGIELKRTRISRAAVDQVLKYQAMTGMPFVLIGSGLGAGVEISECEPNDVAVVIYEEGTFAAKVIVKNSVIKRDFTLRHVCALTETETETGTETENRNRVGGAKRAARKCPADFALTDDLREWAVENAPDVDVDLSTATFRDHTFKTAITDWPATWRNWLRNDQKFVNERRVRGMGRTPAQSFRERDEQLARDKVAAFTGHVAPSAHDLDVIDVDSVTTPLLPGVES